MRQRASGLSPPRHSRMASRRARGSSRSMALWRAGSTAGSSSAWARAAETAGGIRSEPANRGAVQENHLRCATKPSPLCSAPKRRRAYTTTYGRPSRPMTERKTLNKLPLCRRAAEPRQVRGERRERRETLVRMDFLRPRQKHFFALGDVRIGDAAIDRADGRAGFFVVEADALGAERGIDDEDVLALADGLVGTLRLAGAAVDALDRKSTR